MKKIVMLFLSIVFMQVSLYASPGAHISPHKPYHQPKTGSFPIHSQNLQILKQSTNSSIEFTNNTEYLLDIPQDLQKTTEEHESSTSTASTNMSTSNDEEPLVIAVIELSEKNIEDQLKLILQIDEYRSNPNIHALLVKLENIDISLGFASTLFLELKETAKHKPVVGLVLDQCTDACFYVAIGTNPLIVAPLATVGGIGAATILAKYRNPQLRSQTVHADLEPHVFTAGEYKAVFNSYTELKPEYKNYIQSYLDQQYEQFYHTVSQERAVNEEFHESWANGRLHLAGKAKKMGLIDTIGSYSTAITLITELLEKAGYDTENREVLIALPTPAHDPKQEAKQETKSCSPETR